MVGIDHPTYIIAEAGVKSFEQEKSIIIELQEIPDFYKVKK